MEQLTELDYTFIQMESNRTPMHITPIMFYDQSGVKGGRVRFKDILQTFEPQLDEYPVFVLQFGDIGNRPYGNKFKVVLELRRFGSAVKKSLNQFKNNAYPRQLFKWIPGIRERWIQHSQCSGNR